MTGCDFFCGWFLKLEFEREGTKILKKLSSKNIPRTMNVSYILLLLALLPSTSPFHLFPPPRPVLNLHSSPKKIDCVIVGSGLGGLTAAATLQRLYGRDCVVLEQHEDAIGGVGE